MGCCGKTIKKIRNITKGYVAVAIGKSDASLKWIILCKNCEFSTYLSRNDYEVWLLKHGIKVVRRLGELEKLPMLEKQDFEPGRSLYCRICKCWIPAKVKVQDEKCPLGKWDK
jgi:hypothetical protein